MNTPTLRSQALKTITRGGSLALLVVLALGCRRPASIIGSSTLHELSGDGPGYAVAYDARGRGAYLVRHTEEKAADGATLKKSGLAFCAEPPPDAAADTEASRDVDANAELLLTAKALEIGAKGGGSSSENARSEIVDVATRTELVLLMRDALYRICEMNANGVLSNENAENVFRNVMATARTLGQRDNVGKLIDVLAIVAQTEGDVETTARLVEALVGTIRLVALGDQLMQTDDGAKDVAAILLATAMVTQVSGISEEVRKQTLGDVIEQQIKPLKEKPKPTKDEAKQLQLLESIKRQVAQ
jgi:hypothetical protein